MSIPMDLDTTPALSPPTNLIPDFTDPPTLMVPVTATCVLVFILPTLFITIRVFSKSYLAVGHNVEDWLSYLAWAGLVTYTSILFYVEDYGFARHQWDLSMRQFRHIMYFLSTLNCIYGPTTLAAKLSILFQIKRIFAPGSRDAMYWVTVTSIVANIILYTGLSFSYVFQCLPRERIWNPDVPGRCVSTASLNLVSGIMNVLSDIEALLLPAWAIWHLRMPIQRKLAAYAVFGIGLVACMIGIVGVGLRVVVLRNADFTWLCTQAALLVIAEISVVIIVGCMPILPRFYFYLRGRLPNDVSAGSGGFQQHRESSGGSGRKRMSLGSLGNSMAKYVSLGGLGIVTLLSRTDDEEFQLRLNGDTRGAFEESEQSLYRIGSSYSSMYFGRIQALEDNIT